MARKQKFPHLLGSKWTALQKTEGWRHFEVVNRKNQGSWVFAELVASCVRRYAFGLMPNSSKNRALWAGGLATYAGIRP